LLAQRCDGKRRPREATPRERRSAAGEMRDGRSVGDAGDAAAAAIASPTFSRVTKLRILLFA
jgi:hypothetical protein